MLRKRDAQMLSFHVIVMAILALIVLIVSVYIFSTQMGSNTRTLESCEGKGGKCLDDCKDGKVLYDVDCKGNNVCCISIK